MLPEFLFDKEKNTLSMPYDTSILDLIIIGKIIESLRNTFSIEYLENNPKIVFDKYKETKDRLNLELLDKSND